MAIFRDGEIDYIRSLVEYGNESLVLDYKKQWYKINKNEHKDKHREQKYEFIKDIIAFLNVNIELDKYIFIGLKEKKDGGEPTYFPVTDKIDENEVQMIIKQYIEPIPQIDILKGIDIGNRKIDIIRIRKENKDRPYLFQKSFQYQVNDKFGKECKGLGYIRHGSSADVLTRNELSDIFLKKENSIYGYFDLSSNVEPKYLSEVLLFMENMNSVVSREALDLLSYNNPLFVSKFRTVFSELVIRGSLFSNTLNQIESMEYSSRLILNNRDNFDQLNDRIDGGENSIITILITLSLKLYQISNFEGVSIKYYGNKVEINTSEAFDNENYSIIEHHLNYINNLLELGTKIPNLYFKNTSLIKITEINYADYRGRTSYEAATKFRVSEDIIPLLIEPLYSKSNKAEIAIRELLQNAIDACKQVEIEKYEGIIDIELFRSNDRAFLRFSDNGIGMNLYEIKKYYLTVGKSNKSKSSRHLVGKFGIGALSMFLIGSKVRVKTKKLNDPEYNFELIEENKIVSNLRERDVDSNESYTIIEIELNEDYSDNFDDAIKQFYINTLLMNTSHIHINFRLGTDKYEVPNISKVSDWFENILKNESISVSIYKELNRDTSNEELDNDKYINEVLRNANFALFNDILVKASYNLMEYRNIKGSSLPFTVITGKPNDNDLSLELSRDSARIGKNITLSIVKNIYMNEIAKIHDYLDANNGKLNCFRLRRELELLVKKHIKLPMLLIKKNTVKIASSNLLNNLKNNELRYTIWTNDSSSQELNFHDDEYYIVEGFNSSKANIANLIESDSVLLISFKILERYVLNASSSSNGLRQDALRIILKDALPNIEWDIRYNKLWNKIEDNNNQIRSAFRQKTSQGMYKLGVSNEMLVKHIFKEDTGYTDFIVTSNVSKYRVSSSFDSTFDGINNKFELRRLNDTEVIS